MNVRLFLRVSFLVFSTTIVPLNAMLISSKITFNPLHTVERALVVKEIERRGVHALRQEIGNAQNPRLTFDGQRYGAVVPVALHIKTKFFKSDIDKDPLSKAVFEEIAKREAGGYRQVKKPTNYLTPETRFFWSEESDERIPVVEIEAKLINKPELLSIVESHE